jgi:hypothetical protein
MVGLETIRNIPLIGVWLMFAAYASIYITTYISVVPYFSGIIVAHEVRHPLYDKTSEKKLLFPKF